MEQIASGKKFLLQCAFGSKGYVELTQLWRSAEVFVDLPQSAADAVAYFGQLAGHEAEKAFWGQFPGSPSAQLLNHRVKQLVELFRMTRPVLQDLCIALWPAEAMPKSLFGLTARLQDVVPCVDRWKRSACFEGAWRAYACVKTHFRKVDAETCAAGPPADKPRTAEQCFAEVEAGAWTTKATNASPR